MNGDDGEQINPGSPIAFGICPALSPNRFSLILSGWDLWEGYGLIPVSFHAQGKACFREKCSLTGSAGCLAIFMGDTLPGSCLCINVFFFPFPFFPHALTCVLMQKSSWASVPASGSVLFLTSCGTCGLCHECGTHTAQHLWLGWKLCIFFPLQ